MSNFYRAVPFQSRIAKKLKEYAVDIPLQYWKPYYNFVATPVPEVLLAQDPFLMALAEKRKFHGGILRMEPNTCYNWHVDTDRQVGLNMLLADDGKSKCLFLDGESGVVFKTQELQYHPGTYYVFDTQVTHIVLNTTSPRYLFSLEYLEIDRGLTFTELCADIKGIEHGN